MHPILFSIPIREQFLHGSGPILIGLGLVVLGLLYYLSRRRDPEPHFQLGEDGPVIAIAAAAGAGLLYYSLTYRGGDFDFHIYTYGPIMAFAFLAAFALVNHLVRAKGEDLEFFTDLFLWLIVVGVVGAKALYIITDWRDFLARPLDLINCRKGGLVWYGGVLANLGFVYFYARRKTKTFLRVTDLLVAPLSLGLAIGRWGCLMGGCCYGKACDLPWAITYPPWTPGSLYPPLPPGLAVHPSPIYESIGALGIAILCYLVYTRNKRPALPTLTYFTLYPLLRFFLEIYRGDVERKFVIENVLSTSQFISLLIIVPALVLLVRVLRQPLPGPVEVSAPAGNKSKKKKPR